MNKKKYWYPTRHDFKRVSIGRFAAIKFFSNGVGVIIQKLNYPNLYSITILEGSLTSYQIVSGEKILPCLEYKMGFSYYEVRSALRTIQDYVSK